MAGREDFILFDLQKPCKNRKNTLFHVNYLLMKWSKNTCNMEQEYFADIAVFRKRCGISQNFLVPYCKYFWGTLSANGLYERVILRDFSTFLEKMSISVHLFFKYLPFCFHFSLILSKISARP